MHTQPELPKLSLAIPSIPDHLEYLPGILESCSAARERPDEVVVSLSEANLVWRSQLAAIERFGKERFTSFQLLCHSRKVPHGPNRQLATERCSHELISFFDSDDLPHPDRVRILKQFFVRQDVVHVNHSYTPVGLPFVDVPTNTIPIFADAKKLFTAYFPDGRIADCIKASKAYGCGLEKVGVQVHAGHVTVRRSVFEKVRWKDWSELTLGSAEDYEFNIECLYHFQKSAILNLPLSQYRTDHKIGKGIRRKLRRRKRKFIGYYNSLAF